MEKNKIKKPKAKQYSWRSLPVRNKSVTSHAHNGKQYRGVTASMCLQSTWIESICLQATWIESICLQSTLIESICLQSMLIESNTCLESTFGWGVDCFQSTWIVTKTCAFNWHRLNAKFHAQPDVISPRVGTSDGLALVVHTFPHPFPNSLFLILNALLEIDFYTAYETVKMS